MLFNTRQNTSSLDSGVGVGVLWKMTVPRSALPARLKPLRWRVIHHAPTADPITLARIP